MFIYEIFVCININNNNEASQASIIINHEFDTTHYKLIV